MLEYYDITQLKLAEDTGISPTNISGFLQKRNGLSFRNVEKIAARLDIRGIQVKVDRHVDVVNKRLKESRTKNSKNSKNVITLENLTVENYKKFKKIIDDEKTGEILIKLIKTHKN